MATYRTIRMAFWSDPYIETLSASEKLLYLYLFTCPHTNNLGVLAVSTRRMAYDTGLTREAVHAALSLFERDRKIVMDGDTVWLCNFIRHQCSTSPKILASLRALLPAVESADVRKAIVERYPHLFGAAPYPSDRVSVSSGESEREEERKDRDGRIFRACGDAGKIAVRLPGRGRAGRNNPHQELAGFPAQAHPQSVDVLAGVPVQRREGQGGPCRAVPRSFRTGLPSETARIPHALRKRYGKQPRPCQTRH